MSDPERITVAGLIAALEAIEDKTLEVYAPTGSWFAEPISGVQVTDKRYGGDTVVEIVYG